MFPSIDGKKMEKYKPLVSQKNVNAAPMLYSGSVDNKTDK